MFTDGQLWIGQSDEKVCIIPKMANRHGLIAGATGTGKTITLKVLAESFSDCGVPVFLADAKGDLAGMCQPGTDSESMQKRIKKFGLEQVFKYQAYPTCIWDVYGKKGLALRTTISEMGPMLLGRLMGLTDTQQDILSIIFKIADDNQMLLIDIKDLHSMLQYVGDNYKDYTTTYGNITKQSIGAILRNLLALEEQGGKEFFGEPALDIHDWIRNDSNGKGYINVLHCEELMHSPDMYATFMLWMMSELFETMPEAGDGDKPKIVFFFDEAHMLFNEAPKALLQKIEQVVKLIRSKGVGIYFITQSPSDIPDGVLSQLGNRIQHALRAYTPSDQKAVKAAAQSFRANPAFETEKVITELGIGEALISFLDEEGRPSVVQQSKVLPPQSFMGAINEEQRAVAINASGMASKYDESIDRDSAYEILDRKAKEAEEAAEKQAKEEAEEKEEEQKEKEKEQEEKEKEKERRERERDRRSSSGGRRRKSSIEKATDSAMSSIGRELGKKIIRGLMDNFKF